METLAIAPITPEAAYRFLGPIEARDPRGITRSADVRAGCESGLCFGLTLGDQSRGVYVLAVQAGQAYIRWARGVGPLDLTRTVLPVIEQQVAGLDSLAFQTARPGLVRKAQAQGYEVAGWILRKKLK